MGVCSCFPSKSSSKIIISNITHRNNSHPFIHGLDKNEDVIIVKAHSNPPNLINIQCNNKSFSIHETLVTKKSKEKAISKSVLLHNLVNLRIRIIGPKESGKTSFVIRLDQNKFDSFYIPSISQEKTTVKCVLNGKLQRIMFTVEDIINFDINSLLKKEFVFIFFDESTPSSFNEVKTFIEKSDILNNVRYKKDIFIVGNKNDIKSNNLDNLGIEKYCQMNDINFTEISVKTNIGIPKLMQLIDNCLLNKEWYKTFVYSSQQKFALF